MEIIYRIYEKTERKENEYGIFSNLEILSQEVCLCNDREQFKQMIRELYKPQEIYFANSKKRQIGDLICVIISENAYDTEKYLLVNDYICYNCNKEFKANEKMLYKLSDYDLSHLKKICKEKYEQMENELLKMYFCCKNCYIQIRTKLENEFQDYAYNNDLISDIWISKENFSSYNDGFIYMITKKSTGEFYIGQTMYVPIFRWGQHLLTERFKIENIIDYKFEVLEICKREDLNLRESYWINKKRDENPNLSLNKMIPKIKEE